MPQFLFEGHRLDVGLRELRRGSELVMLEPQVFDLITYLVKNRDRVLAKDDLIAAVWDGRIVSDATLSSLSMLHAGQWAILAQNSVNPNLCPQRHSFCWKGARNYGITISRIRRAKRRVHAFARDARQAVRRSASIRQSQ
jgi:hypothetical protein